MIAEQPDDVKGVADAGTVRPPSWPRIVLGVGVGLFGLWFVTRNVAAADLAGQLSAARPGWLALGVAVIVVTGLVKTWRWQLLFHPSSGAPGFGPLFRALMIGQLVNLLLPFVRLGEVARVYALDGRTSKARALGTLVVEKSLDLVIVALTVLVVLPFVVLPTVISDRSVAVTAGVAIVTLLVLVALAYQTTLVVALLKRLAGFLPLPLEEQFLRMAIAGLDGLAALRSRAITGSLVLTSVLIGILSVLTPLVLFPAFGIPFGWEEAAVIHLAVTLGSLPPTTPAKIGIFEAIVAFVLEQFGLADAALILGYGVVFHLVVVVPPLLLGAWAAAREWPGRALFKWPIVPH